LYPALDDYSKMTCDEVRGQLLYVTLLGNRQVNPDDEPFDNDTFMYASLGYEGPECHDLWRLEDGAGAILGWATPESCEIVPRAPCPERILPFKRLQAQQEFRDKWNERYSSPSIVRFFTKEEALQSLKDHAYEAEDALAALKQLYAHHKEAMRQELLQRREWGALKRRFTVDALQAMPYAQCRNALLESGIEGESCGPKDSIVANAREAFALIDRDYRSFAVVLGLHCHEPSNSRRKKAREMAGGLFKIGWPPLRHSLIFLTVGFPPQALAEEARVARELALEVEKARNAEEGGAVGSTPRPTWSTNRYAR
jgi:hypothetical protein